MIFLPQVKLRALQILLQRRPCQIISLYIQQRRLQSPKRHTPRHLQLKLFLHPFPSSPSSSHLFRKHQPSKSWLPNQLLLPSLSTLMRNLLETSFSITVMTIMKKMLFKDPRGSLLARLSRFLPRVPGSRSPSARCTMGRPSKPQSTCMY